MPEPQRKLLLDVFGRLKQKVLWKWETESMLDKPANVKLSKWLPQQDILGHPKLRLFVSHGGQSSCQESLCHQKPMVKSFKM
jgi:UDP:flavonoid glycosyltransferase YjiC (YdhE family)